MSIYILTKVYFNGLWSLSFTNLNKILRKNILIHFLTRYFNDRKQPSGLPSLESYGEIIKLI